MKDWTLVGGTFPSTSTGIPFAYNDPGSPLAGPPQLSGIIEAYYGSSKGTDSEPGGGSSGTTSPDAAAAEAGGASGYETDTEEGDGRRLAAAAAAPEISSAAAAAARFRASARTGEFADSAAAAVADADSAPASPESSPNAVRVCTSARSGEFAAGAAAGAAADAAVAAVDAVPQSWPQPPLERSLSRVQSSVGEADGSPGRMSPERLLSANRLRPFGPSLRHFPELTNSADAIPEVAAAGGNLGSIPEAESVQAVDLEDEVPGSRRQLFRPPDTFGRPAAKLVSFKGQLGSLGPVVWCKEETPDVAPSRQLRWTPSGKFYGDAPTSPKELSQDAPTTAQILARPGAPLSGPTSSRERQISGLPDASSPPASASSQQPQSHLQQSSPRQEALLGFVEAFRVLSSIPELPPASPFDPQPVGQGQEPSPPRAHPSPECAESPWDRTPSPRLLQTPTPEPSPDSDSHFSQPLSSPLSPSPGGEPRDSPRWEASGYASDTGFLHGEASESSYGSAESGAGGSPTRDPSGRQTPSGTQTPPGWQTPSRGLTPSGTQTPSVRGSESPPPRGPQPWGPLAGPASAAPPSPPAPAQGWGVRERWRGLWKLGLWAVKARRSLGANPAPTPRSAESPSQAGEEAGRVLSVYHYLRD